MHIHRNPRSIDVKGFKILWSAVCTKDTLCISQLIQCKVLCCHFVRMNFLTYNIFPAQVRKWMLCLVFFVFFVFIGMIQKVAHYHSNVVYLLWFFTCLTQVYCKYVMSCSTRQTTHTCRKNIQIFFITLTSMHNFINVTERRSWQMMWQSRCMCVCVMQIICSTYNICLAWSRFSELLPIYIPAWWFQSVHFDKSYNNLHKGRPTHRTTQSRNPVTKAGL